ncbi:hypothetical protein ACCAA_60014 [Candidatus Accumulibacter aalborgensis]|uniref:Uncharacterized protein n=1 Tax=Candidatus Accumulibacter aalborgensis TaxID=1860102 RepID=A0A1A8XU89_9PROT|nr:hypothetical protein [Candidatus Accumulibacter aalborgensis]SBT08625.1 hypothetical protein ACCAA_60014 [Candidatus Accumulibacter aalborgensis]
MDKQTPPSDDYDTHWKDAVTRYFPEAHRQIDWIRGYTFLDQDYERNRDKQRIIDRFSVIDWMMQVSQGLQNQLWQELERQLTRRFGPPRVDSSCYD